MTNTENQGRTSSRRRAAWAFAAAFALMIVVVGVAGAILSEGGTEVASPTTAPLTGANSTVPPTPTTQAPTTTVAVTTTEAVTTTTATTTTTVQGLDMEIAVFGMEDDGMPFTASGSAVDEGIMCAEGTKSQLLNYLYHGTQQREEWDTDFTCSDDSGEFRISFTAGYMVITDDDIRYNGSWKVTDGSGSYEGLSGKGAVVGDGFEMILTGSVTGSPSP